MRGFSPTATGEPVLNPSWMSLSKAKAPGWGINGPGVSAEWSQGGESEWNSAAASADETHAAIYQDLEIPRRGDYKLWVRYADWANKNETFVVRIAQNNREVFRGEFGSGDLIDPHDELSMYWGWSFAWDHAAATLERGPARISIEIERASEARRHVDCILITNDTAFVPDGRRKPDFAAMRYLRNWARSGVPLLPLTAAPHATDPQHIWRPAKIAERDFLMPWNIAREYWSTYDKPAAERPLYPFNAEPLEDFIQQYKGVKSVPLFTSKLVVPVIYINQLAEYLREGSPFLRYVRETKSPFAVLINYGSAQLSETEGKAAWDLLTGELRDQFLGWISGESVGYVWDSAAADLKISPSMSRKELLEAHRIFYTNALERKWQSIFHIKTGAMWDKLIPAQSTSSTSFAHALTEWGTRLLGIETAAVQPITAMRIAFTRGAARQFGGAFLYYHAPNFGDTATSFTKSQNLAGPDNFFHSRYGATMGPSLSWYRKSYFLYYMSGASAIYLAQGFDQFFKPGPGEHPLQLNPLGRITDEFIHFVEKHPNRGSPYTPVAFLLDPSHGWDMTDYPQWPFQISQISRSDRALRELFGVAYYPGTVVEGEPATGDRQAFVSGIFGNIFDVLVASDGKMDAIDAYRAVVVGGRIDWTTSWSKKLADYVHNGGLVVLNAAQIKGIPAGFLGIRPLSAVAEADSARCLAGEELQQDLSGQMFRYDRVETIGAQVLIESPTGDPLVTTKKFGKGTVVVCTLPDLLGEDERITPFAAHMLAHVFSQSTPIRVSGDVEYLVNRTADGWIVTLMNNNGVLKPQQGLAQVNRTAVVQARISVEGQTIRRATDWITDKSLQIQKSGSQGVTIDIGPGAIAIVELVQ